MESRSPTIFLDDGGVLNDNSRRAPQWQRLVGEFMTPRLGGTRLDWANANAAVAGQVFNEHFLQAGQDPETDYRAIWDRYQESWLKRMCEKLGVTIPAADILPLAREAHVYITRRVDAAIPGVADAIRELRAEGYRLYTASGTKSADLECYLDTMGVRELFTALYGPDLVNTQKGSVLYYQRIFEHAGVDPATVVVVDDSPRMARQASAVGARAFLVSADPPADLEGVDLIASLAELPVLLRGSAR